MKEKNSLFEKSRAILIALGILFVIMVGYALFAIIKVLFWFFVIGLLVGGILVFNYRSRKG